MEDATAAAKPVARVGVYPSGGTSTGFLTLGDVSSFHGSSLRISRAPHTCDDDDGSHASVCGDVAASGSCRGVSQGLDV